MDPYRALLQLAFPLEGPPPQGGHAYIPRQLFVKVSAGFHSRGELHSVGVVLRRFGTPGQDGLEVDRRPSDILRPRIRAWKRRSLSEFQLAS